MGLTSTIHRALIAHGSSSYSSVCQFLFLRVMGLSCPSFPLSSANAARHLLGQQVGRQTFMVHTISPTPGIRQVSAPSCATSSPHCPRTLHGFLHSNGGGVTGAPYLQHHQGQHFSQSPACPSPRPRLTHVVRQSVRGRPTSTTNIIFLVSLFCLFHPWFCTFQLVRFCKTFAMYDAEYRWGRRADQS